MKDEESSSISISSFILHLLLIFFIIGVYFTIVKTYTYMFLNPSILARIHWLHSLR